jgi:molybdopterin synthase sulfur carrier subunit
LPGATLAEIIDALDKEFPGIAVRLCQDQQIRPGLAVVIDGQIVRGGLAEIVNENSEVHFIPAVAGGGL